MGKPHQDVIISICLQAGIRYHHMGGEGGAAAKKELQMAPPHGNGCNIAILKLLAIAENITG